MYTYVSLILHWFENCSNYVCTLAVVRNYNEYAKKFVKPWAHIFQGSQAPSGYGARLNLFVFIDSSLQNAYIQIKYIFQN